MKPPSVITDAFIPQSSNSLLTLIAIALSLVAFLALRTRSRNTLRNIRGPSPTSLLTGSPRLGSDKDNWLMFVKYKGLWQTLLHKTV